MYANVEITPEEEEEMIKKAAEKIHKHEFDIPAIMVLESIKPLIYVGGQLGRFFITPFLPAFGKDLGAKGEKFFRVFEKQVNVEKLLNLLEEMEDEDKKSKDKKNIDA